TDAVDPVVNAVAVFVALVVPPSPAAGLSEQSAAPASRSSQAIRHDPIIGDARHPTVGICCRARCRKSLRAANTTLSGSPYRGVT
ncbi:MAG TPA: hypothetical protein VI197_09130, partial [Polyangiaceae bacterium]